MTEPLAHLEALLAQATSPPRFPANSRYHATPTTRLETPDGRALVYLRRRFVPPPEAFATLREHTVLGGERLDAITALYFADPELFWRLCDANGALRPDELTETIGRRIRIPLPEGVPEVPVAGEAHLTLLIGPGVPVPTPAFVTDALESVQVTSGTDRAGFQLVFTTGKKSPLSLALLPAGYLDPIVTRVIIIATVRGLPHVLMDGVITRQDVAPSNTPGESKITVTGEDLTALMDIVEMPFMRYPAQPVVARVYAILARYAALGIAPVAISPVIPDFPNVLDEVPSQRGTDLAYLRALAADAGYVFYVEPGPAPGASIGYFGPDVRIPLPQPALSVDMDAHTNVESLSFALDGMSKKIVVLTVFDPVTKKVPVPMVVPNVSILRPPLGLRPTPPAKVEFPDGLASLTPTKAISKALGISFSASDAITASGSLDVTRYGRPLRSRLLVGVRGAGIAYDGFYYVNSVTHNLTRGSYKQSFSLSRDGLISTTPVVVPG